MLTIRKTLLYVETTFLEGEKEAIQPLKMVGAVAVIKNPWASKYFIENLKPEIQEIAPVLSEKLTKLIIDEVGSGNKVEAMGKSAVVGLNGEIEHASALIHTLRFGNIYRQAIGAKSYLAFSNTRGGANSIISIPMMDKNDEGKRSHYLTLQFSINDAPNADEIIVALGASTTGRPHHRIGDRYQDLKELGHDVKNPAAV